MLARRPSNSDTLEEGRRKGGVVVEYGRAQGRKEKSEKE
jgi:hypothetical protein